MVEKKDSRITQTRWSSDQATLEDLHRLVRNIQFLGSQSRQDVNIVMIKQWNAKILTAWNTIICAKASPKEKKSIKTVCKSFRKLGKITKLVGSPGQRKSVIDVKKYYSYLNLISKLENRVLQIANDHNLLLSDKKHEEYETEWW